MKRIFTFISFILLSSIVFSQGIVLVDNQGSVQVVDQQGFSIGSYALNTEYVLTICSSDPLNRHVGLNISAYTLPYGASLKVYNANSVSGDPGISFDHTTVGGTIGAPPSGGNESGCLTLVFKSSVAGATITGNFSLNFLCAARTINITTTEPNFITEEGTKYINACWNYEEQKSELLSFTVEGDFPTNLGYTISNETVTYNWNFNDGNSEQSGLSLTNATHNFSEQRGYTVRVRAIDSKGCPNTNDASLRVRVARSPKWSTQTSKISPAEICMGESASVCCFYETGKWESSVIPVVADVVDLPDIVGQCFESPINQTQFEAGAVLENANQIKRICATLSHTFLGDLLIYIVCPDGTEVMLHAQGGGGIDLGLPGQNIGYEYCWDNVSQNKLVQVAQSIGEAGVVPPGNFKPEGDLNGLTGCDLNGEWTLKICDNWANDSGTNYGWHIKFDDYLYPEPWDYTPTYTNIGWIGEFGSNIPEDNSENCIQATYNTTSTPDQNSIQSFNFQVEDNYGCMHDTSLNVMVKHALDPACCIIPNPDAGPDAMVCGTFQVSLSASLANLNTGLWEFVEGPGTAQFQSTTSNSTSVTVSTYGEYTFVWNEYHKGNFGCTASDEVKVSFLEKLNPELSPINDICAGSPPIQIQGVNFGVLTCSPNPELLDGTTHIFTPSLPGVYTIMNTVNDPCTGTPLSSLQSFTVLDNLQIANQIDLCITAGTEQIVQISWQVQGVEGNPVSSYKVDGVAQSSANYTTSIPSPGSYSYTVTDDNGCSSAHVQGFRDCGCPLYAGTMKSLSLLLLCEGECTSGSNIIHNENYNTAGGAGVFGFILHNGNNVPIKYNSTPTFCQDDLSLDFTYYVSPVCGYPDQDGKPKLSECYSISPGTRVRWTNSTVSSAGEDQLVCGLQAQLNAVLPESGSGYWTSTSQFTPINGTSVASANMEILVSDPGEYTFTWNVANGNCISKDNVKITFTESPSPFAGPNKVVCGNSVEMQGTSGIPDPSSVFNWTAGSGSVVFAPNDQLLTVATTNFYGTYELVLSEYRNGCVGTSSSFVTFIKKPAPSLRPGNTEVCGNSINLEVLTDVGANGLWIAYELNEEDVISGIASNTNFHPNSNSHQVTVSVPDYEGASKKFKFVWREINESNGKQCIDSVSRIIRFAKTPNAGVVNDQLEVCGNCIELEANISGSSFGVGSWSAKTNGSFTNEEGASSPNATFCINPESEFSSTGSLSTQIFWTMKNPEAPTCTSGKEVNITFYRKPVANAGFDKAVCGLEAQLQSTSSFHNSIGVWKVIQQPANSNPASISHANQNSTSVTVPVFGLWEFEYSEKNPGLPGCESKDNVSIEFVAVPVISAGENFDVCGQEAVLNGTSGGFSGAWLNTSGATFEDSSNPKSGVSVNSYGQFEFTWQESNTAVTSPETSCTSNEKVTLTFYQQPSAILFSTQDSIDKNCGLKYSSEFSFSGNQLRVSQPSSNQVGFWRTQSSGVSFGENNSGVNSWDTYASVSTYGEHKFEWVLRSGPLTESFDCKYVAGPITVSFIEQPKAKAGNDITFCDLSGSLSAEIPNPGVGVWTSPSEANIVISDPNSPNSIVKSEVYNTETSPSYKLYWTVSNEGCNASDSVNVTFAPAPKSEFEIIPPKCFGESAILIAEDTSLGQYTWEYNGGVVEKTIKNDKGAPHSVLVYWSDKSKTHNVSLMTTNSWGCPSSIQTGVVQEPEQPVYSALIIKDTCNLKKGGIKLIDNDNLYSFFWTDPNFGPAVGTPITIVNNIPAGDYNIKTSYVSFNAVDYDDQYTAYFGSINCESLVEYTIPSIGAIKAKFEISPEIILEDLTAPDAKLVFINKTDYDGVKRRCFWKFGDGESQMKCDELMEHVYTKAGCYYPELIVINKELPECSDTARLTTCIRVKDHSVIDVPNVFSPNGDGINDYFQVKATSLRSFTGVIANRWGRTIYTWTNWQDYTSGWDGKINGGSDASAGVYYYIIKAEGFDGKKYEASGVLHLMRD